MLDIDNLTTENDEAPSLESILAEYADYPGPAPEPGQEPSGDGYEPPEDYTSEHGIDFESDGPGLYAGIDSGTAEYSSPPEPIQEPDYERDAYGYHGRLRRGFERLRRKVSVPEADEYTPEPAGEPDFAGDDDVKVYRPSTQLPEGDEDVKVYPPRRKRSLDDVVAEAERRSENWSAHYDADARDYASFDSGAYASAPYDARDYAAPDADALDYGADDMRAYAPDEDVRDYGVDSDEGYDYASPDSDTPRRDYGRAPKAKNPILALLAVLGVKLGNAQTAGEAVSPEDDEDIGVGSCPRTRPRSTTPGT